MNDITTKQEKSKGAVCYNELRVAMRHYLEKNTQYQNLQEEYIQLQQQYSNLKAKKSLREGKQSPKDELNRYKARRIPQLTNRTESVREENKVATKEYFQLKMDLDQIKNEKETACLESLQMKADHQKLKQEYEASLQNLEALKNHYVKNIEEKITALKQTSKELSYECAMLKLSFNKTQSKRIELLKHVDEISADNTGLRRNISKALNNRDKVLMNAQKLSIRNQKLHKKYRQKNKSVKPFSSSLKSLFENPTKGDEDSVKVLDSSTITSSSCNEEIPSNIEVTCEIDEFSSSDLDFSTITFR